MYFEAYCIDLDSKLKKSAKKSLGDDGLNESNARESISKFAAHPSLHCSRSFSRFPPDRSVISNPPDCSALTCLCLATGYKLSDQLFILIFPSFRSIQFYFYSALCESHPYLYR